MDAPPQSVGPYSSFLTLEGAQRIRSSGALQRPRRSVGFCATRTSDPLGRVAIRTPRADATRPEDRRYCDAGAATRWPKGTHLPNRIPGEGWVSKPTRAGAPSLVGGQAAPQREGRGAVSCGSPPDLARCVLRSRGPNGESADLRVRHRSGTGCPTVSTGASDLAQPCGLRMAAVRLMGAGGFEPP